MAKAKTEKPKKIEMDVRAEIGDLVNGYALEYILSALSNNDLKALGSPGEVARIGAALSALGNAYEKASKALAKDWLDVNKVNNLADNDVVFTGRNGYDSHSLDLEVLAELYPEDEHPELYKTVVDTNTFKETYPVEKFPHLYNTSYVDPTIAVQLPFKSKTIEVGESK